MTAPITRNERQRLQDLAKQVAERAGTDAMTSRISRWYAHNTGHSHDPMMVFESR